MIVLVKLTAHRLVTTVYHPQLQHHMSTNLHIAPKAEPPWTPDSYHPQSQRSPYPTATIVPSISENQQPQTSSIANQRSPSSSPDQYPTTSPTLVATTTATMRTERIVSVKERNIAMAETTYQQTITPSNHRSMINLQTLSPQTPSSTTKMTTKSVTKAVSPMLKHLIPPLTTQQTTPLTRDTISSRTPELATIQPTTPSTMDLRHMREPLSINTTEVNSRMTPINTQTTEPLRSTTSPTRASTSQHFQQLTPKSQSKSNSLQSYQNQVRHYRRAAPLQVSPRSQAVERQRIAALNRDRAIALWGQQVQEQLLEAATSSQLLCRNSLPRQLKDYRVGERNSSPEEMIDPLDLEFCVSSPSLFERSSDGSAGSESTEMSTSPRTAIQRIT